MTRKKTDRCTGHCCREFWLGFSPEELMGAYHRWQQGGRGERATMSGTSQERELAEIHLIAPMVIHLGYTDQDPRRVNPTDADLKGEKIKGHRYRCKHWDSKTGDCTIYDIRPVMCRDYPGRGKGCNYAACTWRSRKAKKETRAERAKRRRRLLEEGKKS